MSFLPLCNHAKFGINFKKPPVVLILQNRFSFALQIFNLVITWLKTVNAMNRSFLLCILFLGDKESPNFLIQQQTLACQVTYQKKDEFAHYSHSSKSQLLVKKKFKCINLTYVFDKVSLTVYVFDVMKSPIDGRAQQWFW